LRFPSRKGDGAFFDLVQKQLFKCEGVEKVEVNPLTGSVLVIHQSSTQAIGEFLGKAGMPFPGDSDSGATQLRRQVSASFSGLNSQIKKAVGGEIDLWNLVFLFLIGSGVYQVARGNIAAIPWYTAFYYAFNILSKAKDKGGE
jgi:hypothetical protein